ncbi:MAG TPA: hypothetical protein VGB43_04885, partial [Flavobacterium sp.]
NTPIENFKIKIGEYRSEFHSDGGGVDYFVQFVDSTFTDQQGNFDKTFRTTGNGSKYKLHFEATDQVWTLGQTTIDIPNIGNQNQINLGFSHLYPVDLKITLNDVDYLPIEMAASLWPLNSEEITVNNIEQTRRIYVTKLSQNAITFYRHLPNGTEQTAIIWMPATNSTILTEFIINLSNADFN